MSNKKISASGKGKGQGKSKGGASMDRTHTGDMAHMTSAKAMQGMAKKMMKG